MEEAAWLQAAAAVGTLVAAVWGFWYVRTQIELIKRSLLSQANGSLNEQGQFILQYISSNPETYDYLYEGKRLSKGDPSYIQVYCLCEMTANYCDMTLTMLPDLDPKVAHIWNNFITETLQRSPLLRKHIEKFKTWYSDELVVRAGQISSVEGRPG